MKHLFLLRHAKSAWDDFDLPDHERPLSRRGQRGARLIAEALAADGSLPDRILCSPAERCRQTLAILLERIGTAPDVVFVDAIYQPASPDYRNVIGGRGGDAERLMVIGHNPTIQATAISLAGSGEDDLVEKMAAKYPAGALAVLAFDIADWWALAPHTGRLTTYLVPRALVAAAEAGRNT
jgi:phosphohistidine phosphatase